jgi:hypothetical protein
LDKQGQSDIIFILPKIETVSQLKCEIEDEPENAIDYVSKEHILLANFTKYVQYAHEKRENNQLIVSRFRNKIRRKER